ncbi:SRPBCC family protein [Allosphingosinicella sp.]|uniref:SRPBCC family protein n=1 Tax=Allosphingosinicella sp. TaxID=2823234 RepID=UPI002ED81691
MTSTDAAATASVRKSVTVNAGPERAFKVFTERMGAWWPKTHSTGSAPLADAIIEPRLGGRWYERGEDGSECEWGKVLAWDPPRGLILAWQTNGEWKFDENLITEVEIVFTEVEPGRTRVDLEHRNLDRFGPASDQMREAFESPDGWSGILAKYVEEAEAAA